MKNIIYLALGTLFGIILIKSEVASWFRIQEMFRFHSFHMYGVIGTAIVVGATSILLLKKFKVRTRQGEPIQFANQTLHKGHIYGGTIFGLGWAITGACPGPLYALFGSGFTIMGMALLSAVVGTWVYGYLRASLPH